MLKNSRWLLLVITLVLLDQWSKAWVVFHFSDLPERVCAFLNIIWRSNTGAAFSFFSGEHWSISSAYLLGGVSIVASVCLLIWLLQLPVHKTLTACALSFILAGALGNLIDRFRLGFVTDFLDFHVGAWHFATFNVADACISVGAIFLIFNGIFLKNK